MELGTNFAPRHIQSALWVQARLAQDPLGLENFVTAIRRMQPTIAYEMFPGSDFYAALPEPMRKDLEKKLQGILNTEKLWGIVKALSKSSFDALGIRALSQGAWQGKFTPNNILSFVSDEVLGRKPEWKEWTRYYYPNNLARIAAAASAYVYHQDGVLWFREITDAYAGKLQARTESKQYHAHPDWYMHAEGVVVTKKDKVTGKEVPIKLREAKSVIAKMWGDGYSGGFTLHDGVLYFLNLRNPKTGFEEFYGNTHDLFKSVASTVIGKELPIAPEQRIISQDTYTIRKAHFVGMVEGEGGVIYEPSKKGNKAPTPTKARDWLKERLTPDQLSAVDNMRHTAAQEIRATAERAGMTDALPGMGIRVEMEGDALTALVDPDKIVDLTRRAADDEKYAGSMNIPNLTGNIRERDVARILYQQNKASIDRARRLMTWEDIVNQAKEIHISADTLKRWSAKGMLTREEMLALIRLNKWAVKNLTNTAINYERQRTPAALMESQLAYEAAAKIMEVYQKAATEWGYIGKVLSLQQEIKPLSRSGIADPKKLLAARNQALLAKVNKALGNQELSAEKMARLASLLSDPNVDERAVAKFIAETAHVSLGQKLYTIWVNNLFSWVTHKVNFAGNAVFMALSYPTKTLAGAFDLIRSVATGTPREMYAGEAWYTAMGNLSAIPDAIYTAMKVMIDPTLSTESKIENIKGLPFKSTAGRIAFTHNLMLLTAADEFSKALIVRGELYAKAYRLIRQLKPDDPGALFDAIMANPERYIEGIGDITRKEALYRTLQSESKLADWLSAEPTGVLKWVVPFKRTLINLLKMAAEHSPLEAAALAVGKTFKPTKEKLSTAEVEEQLAKATVGSSLLLMGLLLASKGLISGSGPDDPKERENLYATGWRPYSIKTPWGRIEYQRIDLLASLLGPIADAYDLLTYASLDDAAADKVMGRAMSMVARNILDKTMMLGLSKAIMATMYPARYGEKFWYSFIGSMIPANATLVQRIMDPTIRKPENIWEVLKSRLPILSEDVAPVYDHWGREVAPSEGLSIMQRLFNPTPIFDDDISTPLDQVMLENNIKLAKPPQRAVFRNISVDLTKDEIEQFAMMRRKAYEVLQRMAPMLEKLPPDIAAKQVHRIVEQYDQIAAAKVKNSADFLSRWRDALATKGAEREWLTERFGRQEE